MAAARRPAGKPARKTTKADNKTKPTAADVGAFLDAVESDTRRRDGYALCDLMARVSGEQPVMWGPSIIGFGQAAYTTEAGREGRICRIGFSPRKGAISFYVPCDDAARAGILPRLGKHRRGKGCLYVNKLADVDMAVLEEFVRNGWAHSLKASPPA